VVYGPASAGLKPDLDWLEATLKGDKPPKMVTIVNPCNPAGVPHMYMRTCVHQLRSLSTALLCRETREP
jgi:hypothetical protein